ncbi:MAG: FAD-dependent oxidoreductase, partial [Actinobacteria bacterium]|nr:FAD-dependent oxidoreductase [Actinomycetota bacterium]
MRIALPRRLAAPEPTWTRDVDVVVLGSGAAGLAAALAARPVRNVLIVTKDTLDAGSTAWAQGGLAAVLDPTDTFAEHVRDTLEAGAGLCDEAAVTSLVRDAPTAIDYLEKLGAAFDPGADGERALTREGGHSRSRIVHAGGDQSGAELSTFEGLALSGFWLHRNIFNRADRFRIEAEAAGLGGQTGGPDYSLTARFQRPAVYGPDTSFTAEIGLEHLDEPDYRSDSITLGLAASRAFSEMLTGDLGIKLTASEAT